MRMSMCPMCLCVSKTIIDNIMRNRLVLIFSCCFFCLGCTNPKAFGEDSLSVKINRFDVDLYQYLQNEKSADDLLQKDSSFLNIFGENVIFTGRIDSVGFFDRLRSFFSEPTLMSLYQNQQEVFSDLTPYEQELSTGIQFLLGEFTQLKLPEFYMHVSGLNQNIVVTDSILSLSVDKYLGQDFPLYQEFFYDYQRQQMTPERIVPDYLLGLLYSEFSFDRSENTLLSYMLYEGTLRYVLSRILPERKAWELFGYTEAQYNWCVKNESRIWKTILQQKQLYSTDYLTIAQYINEAPYTVPLNSSSPGKVGIWGGFRIIESYMQQHPKATLQELINRTDYQQLFIEAKYKP